MTSARPGLSVRAVRRLTADPRPWLSCDDCFERLDWYVERALAGVAGADTALRAHLLDCAACYEEACGLITLVAAEQEIATDTALSLLNRDLARPRPC